MSSRHFHGYPGWWSSIVPIDGLIATDNKPPVDACPLAQAPESDSALVGPEALTLLCQSQDSILKTPSAPLYNFQRYRSPSHPSYAHEGVPADSTSYPSRNTQEEPGMYTAWSPTASMRRGKAELLLKEHGSPPGMRVTAGGRIVSLGL